MATASAPYLPARGQVNLDQFPDNEEHGRSRQFLVLKAQKWVYELELGTGSRKVAYTPPKNEGVVSLSGASRIVAEALYKLYVKSPMTTVNGAIKWSVETMPDVTPLDDVDLGRGRRGAIGQGAYRTGVEYFQRSLEAALATNRAAKAAKAADARRDGFRQVSGLTHKVGAAV